MMLRCLEIDDEQERSQASKTWPQLYARKYS